MARLAVSYSEAPPPVPIKRAKPFLLILVAITVLGFVWRYPTAAFLAKNIVFAGLLVLVPTLGKWIADVLVNEGPSINLDNEKYRFVRIATELLGFLTVVWTFTFWIGGYRMSWRAIVYAALLILLIEVGGHYIGWRKERVLQRIAKQKILGASTRQLRSMFKREPLVYVTIPLGIITASILGIVFELGGQRSLDLALGLILLLSSVGLICFLLVSLIRMADPMFAEAKVSQPQISRSGTGPNLLRAVKAEVPETRKAKKEQRERDLSLLVVVSDFRKVYLYNSLHNVILLAVFSSLISRALGLGLGMKEWIISTAILTFLMCQLPYVIGQGLMHDRALRRFEGTELVDMKAALKKYAPMLPKSEFAIALVTSNTAGGLLLYLFTETLKGKL